MASLNSDVKMFLPNHLFNRNSFLLISIVVFIPLTLLSCHGERIYNILDSIIIRKTSKGLVSSIAMEIWLRS